MSAQREQGDADDANEGERRINQAAILARLDERTKFIKGDMDKIAGQVSMLAQNLDGRFVTKEEFRPIKSVVYGMVALILSGVVGAIITLVVK